MTTSHDTVFLQSCILKAIWAPAEDALSAQHPCKYNSAEQAKYHTNNVERWVKSLQLSTR